MFIIQLGALRLWHLEEARKLEIKIRNINNLHNWKIKYAIHLHKQDMQLAILL